jgi:hypothetical protein
MMNVNTTKFGTLYLNDLYGKEILQALILRA